MFGYEIRTKKKPSGCIYMYINIYFEVFTI